MKFLTCKLVIVTFSLMFSVAVTGEMIVKITSAPVLEKQYKAFVARQAKPVEQRTKITGMHLNQAIASLVIIKQALHHGGLDIDYDFVHVPNVKRAQLMLAKGIALIASNTPFSIAIDESVFKSSAIIAHGGLIKGIYGLASNKALMKVTSLKELQSFSALTNSTWLVDIETLQAIKPKSLYSTPLFSSMLQLINNRGIDFTLLKIDANVDKIATEHGVKLAMVPGIGIELMGTRHFIVSKKHPDGEKVYKALEKGLAVLREKGLIRQYYQDVGTIPANGSNIKILNAIKSKPDS